MKPWFVRAAVWLGLLVVCSVGQMPNALAAPGVPVVLPDARPMIFPVAGAPGPETWLFGQAYGNTTGAFNNGQRWYRAGQGLHFGVDLTMPCGTPLVAVADGVVAFRDDPGFGSLPHNLVLRHDTLGVNTLYGHLLEPPPVFPGQPVAQGQVIGFSGDPDETCDSRPHLHFEVRSIDYGRAFNPVDWIAGNWHMLALVGPFGYPIFTQDVYNARQWLSLDDQPTVTFWGRTLNAYTLATPPLGERVPPPNPPLARSLPALDAATATATLRAVGLEGCCARPFWLPGRSDRVVVVDGAAGTRAALFAYDAFNGVLAEVLGDAPLPTLSPSGAYTLAQEGNAVVVRAVGEGLPWTVDTAGRPAALSTDDQRLLWTVTSDVVAPGQTRPPSSVWVQHRADAAPRLLHTQAGASARWLDDQRVLLAVRNGLETRLDVLHVGTGDAFTLGAWNNLRGLSVAPGGARVAFYTPFNGEASAVWLVETTPGTTPVRMPWFGAWRWRDADTLYVIPFQPSATTQTLHAHRLADGAFFPLTSSTTTPFLVADGEWHVSPEGAHIASRMPPRAP